MAKETQSTTVDIGAHLEMRSKELSSYRDGIVQTLNNVTAEIQRLQQQQAGLLEEIHRVDGAIAENENLRSTISKDVK